ncbi:MAG: uracil-DNA glycosylase [Deltaproteobacteria bacterium]|nr:uracil-DNA glycosylase [Deltaproteobacteria bacterium]
MSDSTPQERLREALRGLRAFVEEARESFVEGFPRAGTAHLAAARASAGATVGGRSAEAPSELAVVREEIGDCRRCKLCERRTQIVFGVGNPHAELLFVGEGPGEDEDRMGEPFVGRAGQLLTDIITRGMGLQRSEVYIANVVKCRPPGNRNPEPDEIAACQPFLFRQIDVISPKVIVALGKFAAQTLLGTVTPISKLRGRWFEFRGRKLMPTFHPSYILRNPADKKLVWEDVQLVMQELGLPLPKSAKPRA